MSSEVPKIGFSLPQTSLNNSAKPEAKEAEKPVVQESAAAFRGNGADVMNALNVAGQYNAAQVGIGKIVDPAKYLTPERIKDIQNSMIAFEGGVRTHSAMLEEEFGHISEYSSLSESDKLEMAAKSFAFNG